MRHTCPKAQPKPYDAHVRHRYVSFVTCDVPWQAAKMAADIKAQALTSDLETARKVRLASIVALLASQLQCYFRSDLMPATAAAASCHSCQLSQLTAGLVLHAHSHCDILNCVMSMAAYRKQPFFRVFLSCSLSYMLFILYHDRSLLSWRLLLLRRSKPSRHSSLRCGCVER